MNPKTMLAQLLSTVFLALPLVAQCPVNVDSATSSPLPTCEIQFDNTQAGAQVRFVLRRLGVIIGTTEIAEWGVVTDQKVSVLFSNAGQHVQAQAGDFVQAEVVGSQPSNDVKVK